MWATWWVWVVGGFALGALEALAPGYFFLGFAMGAVVTGALVGFGLLGGSLSVALLVFAVASLAAWVALRQGLGRRNGQVKIWEKDVND